VECSGHGVCAREPATCREEEGCLAVCECADGWAGAACQRSTESMAEVRAMRDNFLALQSNSLAAADLSSAAAVTQQAETLRNVANVDELTPRSRDLVMGMVAALASATTDAIPETTAASLLTVAIESAMYALSRASSARRRRRLMWALGDAIARRLDVEDPGALADRMKTTVGTVTGAVMRGMVPGDEPVSFSTRGAAVTVARTSVSDAASYGTDGGSSLTLTGSGSSGGLGGAVGDVDVQAVTWATNPVSVLCVSVPASVGACLFQPSNSPRAKLLHASLLCTSCTVFFGHIATWIVHPAVCLCAVFVGGGRCVGGRHDIVV
jgi:hypothetical protein